MTRLSISHKVLSIDLLFENELGARLWAEQWAWHYFDRSGEWEHNSYEFNCEHPEEYIRGVSIFTHEIDVYNGHLPLDDCYAPDYQQVSGEG